jgi:hypothetical protein
LGLHGRRGSAQIARAPLNIALRQVGRILGDLDQSEADVRVVLASGFIYRDGRLVNTDKCEVMFPDWRFQYGPMKTLTATCSATLPLVTRMFSLGHIAGKLNIVSDR